jgi:hypothetical protein
MMYSRKEYAAAKGVRWTHLQEVAFDDFFGEKVAGRYQVSSNPTDARLPAIDASSLGQKQLRSNHPVI